MQLIGTKIYKFQIHFVITSGLKITFCFQGIVYLHKSIDMQSMEKQKYNVPIRKGGIRSGAFEMDI